MARATLTAILLGSLEGVDPGSGAKEELSASHALECCGCH